MLRLPVCFLLVLALLVTAFTPPLHAQDALGLEIFFMTYPPSAALSTEKAVCNEAKPQMVSPRTCLALGNSPERALCLEIPLTESENLVISFFPFSTSHRLTSFPHDGGLGPPEPFFPDGDDDDKPISCPTVNGRAATTSSSRGRSTVGSRSRLQPAPGAIAQASPGAVAQAAPRAPRIYLATTGDAFGVGEIPILDSGSRRYAGVIDLSVAAAAEIKTLAVNDDETLLIAASNRNHDGTLSIPLDNGSLFFIDLTSNQVIRQLKFPQPAFPLAMRFTSDGETLYVLDRANFTTPPEPARVYVVDMASRAITRTIAMPAAGAAVDLALTPDDAVLFISVQRTDERGARYTELFPLDTRTTTFNGVIRLPGFTTGPIAMHPAGTRLYAPHRGRPIMVIDTATYQISEIPGVTVGLADLYGASVSSNGRYLVLSATNDDRITVVDLAAGEVAAEIETGALLALPAVVLR